MARKRSGKSQAWETLENRGADQSIANRDVYAAQQLERSTIEQKQSKTSRIVVVAIIAAMLTAVVWATYSAIHMGVDMMSGAFSNGEPKVPTFFQEENVEGTRPTQMQLCYRLLDAAGEPMADSPCYEELEEAQQAAPQWVFDDIAAQELALEEKANEGPAGLMAYMLMLGLLKVSLSLGTGALAGGIAYPLLMRNLDAQNLMHDTTDINQYANDQHVALPEEVVRKFDWFPDAGAHVGIEANSLISHVMLDPKGLKQVEVSVRAKKDMLDADGDIEYHKGQIMLDDSGEIMTRMMPLVDVAFGEDLFTASGMPKDKTLRGRFDTTKIPYNKDGSDREKVGTYATVADMINAEWYVPLYEAQRPAGAYIVDTAPVNTMVLAITRGGKGQTYIEPMVDMWLRETKANNMVINDPKGELLVKHYVRATMRGYQVIQFNLINPMKTDIYNPLGLAAEAAREGDATKCALYVENIADIFFPLDGGEDPMWPAAANNAFKRAAYGMIDFYLEEERELRALALRVDMEPKVLERLLDEKWGKVSLYNCYQLFVQLSSKKVKNPVKELTEKQKAGDFGSIENETFDEVAYEEARSDAEEKAFIWDDQPEMDMLTLYFNATAALPQNSMRTLVSNADNALRAMGVAEKMLASVYGIAITAMSFFTDPTISTLTSGTPSQNTDLGGLSFPRRMGVRFGMNYLKRDHLIGAQAVWDAYGDPGFTQPLGKDFDHEDIVSREGWARYYFVGKFDGDKAWLRLRLVNAQTGMLIRTFHFLFTKDYQTSLNGRFYVTDPITDKKIIRNGILLELREGADGTFAPGHTTYPQVQLTNIAHAEPDKEMGTSNAIISSMVRYSEAPKAVFLVTPPHLMKYAKLILILVKQLVDLNFDKSYMTKEDQKPLFKTRFMLDELGNLQSEGHGIAGFETMLSIGLGQEQQFTIILQTLQQLRDVYGESTDKIVQGNAQPLDARIATPTGWTTMGQAQVGTQVLTPAGGTSVVDGVYPKGTRPVYRVTRRDGSSTVACDEHLWEVIVEPKKEAG